MLLHSSFRRAAVRHYSYFAFFSLLAASFLTIVSAHTQSVNAQENVESRVREYFKDIPVMIAIGKCESGFRQFDDAGDALHGGTGSMIGVFQIFDDAHRDAALSLGYDFHTLQGNLEYARYLYVQSGTDPWIASYPCWSKEVATMQAAAEADTARAEPLVEVALPLITGNLTETLTFGMTHVQVKTLQQLLNRAGFTVAGSSEGANAPGSPGNETTLFGGLTRAAVRRFQCEKNIVCSGDEYSTSYGVVGPRTRAALMATLAAATETTTVAMVTDVPAQGISQTLTVPHEPSVAPHTHPSVDAAPASDEKALRSQVAALTLQVHALLAQISALSL